MNGGRIGQRNVPGVDGTGGVWSLQEIANARRAGVWPWDGIDTFDTDSTAQYTQHAESAATWSVANGELTASGGSRSHFVRNGPSYTDVAVEVDVTRAYNGGVVARFVDINNHYLLAMIDDGGVNSSENLTIFKRVSGTYTQLNVLNTSWPTGSFRTIRFEVVGTTLTAYMNGVQVLQATDAAIVGPGGVGLRNHSSGVSIYQTFRWGRR